MGYHKTRIDLGLTSGRIFSVLCGRINLGCASVCPYKFVWKKIIFPVHFTHYHAQVLVNIIFLTLISIKHCVWGVINPDTCSTEGYTLAAPLCILPLSLGNTCPEINPRSFPCMYLISLKSTSVFLA